MVRNLADLDAVVNASLDDLTVAINRAEDSDRKAAVTRMCRIHHFSKGGESVIVPFPVVRLMVDIKTERGRQSLTETERDLLLVLPQGFVKYGPRPRSGDMSIFYLSGLPRRARYDILPQSTSS